MSDLLDPHLQGVYARREPGPPVDPAAIDLALAAVEVFHEEPHLRTPIQFVVDGPPTKYNLLGTCMLLEGIDLRCLNPVNERWETGIAILLGDLHFTTYDFYALEEYNNAAADPNELYGWLVEYAQWPQRLDPALRKAPVAW